MKINYKNQEHKMQIKREQNAKLINKRTNLPRETLLIFKTCLWFYAEHVLALWHWMAHAFTNDLHRNLFNLYFINEV